MSTLPRRLFLGLAASAASFVTAAAQTPPLLRTLNGDSAGDWLGFSVSAVGDLDHDGCADLLVGAPFDDEGIVKLVSGRTGGLLHQWRGQSVVDAFGAAVACAGDVDADGVPDLIVGAFLDDDYGTDAGSAWVYSGHDFSLLFVLHNDVPGAEFGWAVAGAGDVDHDGHDDVIVGAPSDAAPQPGVRPGSATVYSGATGAVLFRWFGDGHNDRFGHSVDGAGDLDGDGFVELVVGAPWDDNTFSNAGMARVFSTSPAHAANPIRYSFDGDGLGYEFGTSVCGAGDVDQDGHGDLFVGQPEDKVFGDDAGSAVLFSGFTGVRLRTYYGSTSYSYYGYWVDAGDCDGDGVPDLIVGEPRLDVTPFDDRGAVHVHSGAAHAAPQSLLFVCYGTANGGRLGQSVAALGDTNRDGFGDFAAGGHLATTLAGNQSGYCRMWAGTTFQGSTRLQGAGCPAGSPLSLGYGAAPHVGQPFDIVVGNGPAAATPGWVVFGFANGAPFPVDLGAIGLLGCSQYQPVDLLVGVVLVGGTATLNLTVSPAAWPAGIVFHNQALALDAASPIGMRISAGGTVILGQ